MMKNDVIIQILHYAKCRLYLCLNLNFKTADCLNLNLHFNSCTIDPSATPTVVVVPTFLSEDIYISSLLEQNESKRKF